MYCTLIFLLIRMLILVNPIDSETWNYGKHGPDVWKETYPTCGGQKQSPINIQTACTVYQHFSKFIFTSEHHQQIRFRLTNNGHVIVAEPDTSIQLTLTGGNLNGTYAFQNFHLHWGPNHNSGSEHQVNGDKSAGESHFVYSDIATNQRVALSFLMESPPSTNFTVHKIKTSQYIAMEKQWHTYFDTAQQLTHANDSRTVNLSLSVLMGSNQVDFWRYEGSLTTPPCSENVIWTIFKEPISIEDFEFEHFRDDLFFESYRGPQPLYYRQVYRSFSKEDLSTIPDQNYCSNKQSQATFLFNIIHQTLISSLLFSFIIFY